ncbi:MAG: hypothetical protein H6838_11515 [Planctomycetes bacterium]|nr:hypothetical protein [Planctomycetota bacterium]MCB9886113.1 hypothetical protein [Planctomycetota bacterium]
MRTEPILVSRRNMLFAAAAVPAAGLLSSCNTAGAARRRPEHDGTTPHQTEGPFYRLFSTARDTLREPGLQGTELDVTGRVLDKRGRPLANTLLDFWHCDAAGVYDVRGYKLRGHQFTDAEGRFKLATIEPGVYPGRTRHIHVKVQPAGDDTPSTPRQLNLTTQLYFPGDPGNAKDGLFDDALLMAIDRDGARLQARFDFVLDLG